MATADGFGLCDAVLVLSGYEGGDDRQTDRLPNLTIQKGAATDPTTFDLKVVGFDPTTFGLKVVGSDPATLDLKVAGSGYSCLVSSVAIWLRLNGFEDNF